MCSRSVVTQLRQSLGAVSVNPFHTCDAAALRDKFCRSIGGRCKLSLLASPLRLDWGRGFAPNNVLRGGQDENHTTTQSGRIGRRTRTAGESRMGGRRCSFVRQNPSWAAENG